jgi:SAM-dependent methyltransferase
MPWRNAISNFAVGGRTFWRATFDRIKRIIYNMSHVDSPKDSSITPGKRVCPVERAGSLDSGLRRWIQNPRKILSPYVRSGMTVLDFGCGPGFFTTTLAELVGPTGHVYAADLQEGMLCLVKAKIQDSNWESRITLHHCEPERIGLDVKLDFVLAFYVVHELPDQQLWFRQIADLLRPGGSLLIVEPRFFHVSKSDFQGTISKACAAGLRAAATPRVFLSQIVLLSKPIG